MNSLFSLFGATWRRRSLLWLTLVEGIIKQQQLLQTTYSRNFFSPCYDYPLKEFRQEFLILQRFENVSNIRINLDDILPFNCRIYPEIWTQKRNFITKLFPSHSRLYWTLIISWTMVSNVCLINSKPNLWKVWILCCCWLLSAAFERCSLWLEQFSNVSEALNLLLPFHFIYLLGSIPRLVKSKLRAGFLSLREIQENIKS